jgi:hypothetical protein
MARLSHLLVPPDIPKNADPDVAEPKVDKVTHSRTAVIPRGEPGTREHIDVENKVTIERCYIEKRGSWQK